MTTPRGHTLCRSHMHSCAQGGHIKSGLMVEPSGCTFLRESPCPGALKTVALARMKSARFPSQTLSLVYVFCTPATVTHAALLCFPEKPGLAFTQQASCSLLSDFYLQDLSGIGDLKNTLKLKSSCRYCLASQHVSSLYDKE